jgi:hypothetical protein
MLYVVAFDDGKKIKEAVADIETVVSLANIFERAKVDYKIFAATKDVSPVFFGFNKNLFEHWLEPGKSFKR